MVSFLYGRRRGFFSDHPASRSLNISEYSMDGMEQANKGIFAMRGRAMSVTKHPSLLKKSPMGEHLLRFRYHLRSNLHSKSKVMRLPGLFQLADPFSATQGSAFSGLRRTTFPCTKLPFDNSQNSSHIYVEYGDAEPTNMYSLEGANAEGFYRFSGRLRDESCF